MRPDRHFSVFRPALLALAVLALLSRTAAPPGTMVADTGHGAALVICTGHGPITAPDAPAKSPASRGHTDKACEFAAHASYGLAATTLALVGYSDWTPSSIAQPIVLATTGSGLAAPPPPSHAPPSTLV